MKRIGLGRLGCTAGLGCLGLIGALVFVSGLTVVFMIQQSNATAIPLPTLLRAVAPNTATPMPAATTTADDSGGLLVVTTISQPALPVANNNLPEPSPTHSSANSVTNLVTATPPAPGTYQPFFSGQTQIAQQSVTAMLAARTSWYGRLTQGAVDYASTLRALGTPVNLTATARAGAANQP